jgi:hypothetical protein
MSTIQNNRKHVPFPCTTETTDTWQAAETWKTLCTKKGGALSQKRVQKNGGLALRNDL